MAYFNKQVSVVAAHGDIFKVADKTAEKIFQLEVEIATLKQELASVQAQLEGAKGRLSILDPIMGAANEFIDVVNKAFSGMNMATFDQATVEKLQKAVRTQLKGLERTKKKLVASDTTLNLLGAAQEFSDLMTSLGKQFDTSMTNSMQVAIFSNQESSRDSITAMPVFSAEGGPIIMTAKTFQESMLAAATGASVLTEGKVTAEIKALNAEIKALKLEVELAESKKLVAEERVENLERKLSDAHLEIEALKQQTSRVTPLEESFQVESHVSGSPTEGSTIEELNRLKKAYGELDAEHKRLRNSYIEIRKGAQNRKLIEVSRDYERRREITTELEGELNTFLQKYQPALLEKFREEFPPFYLRPLNLRPSSSGDTGVESPFQSPAKAGTSLQSVLLRKVTLKKKGTSPKSPGSAQTTPVKSAGSEQKTPGSAGAVDDIYNQDTASDPTYSPSQLKIRSNFGRNAKGSTKPPASHQIKLGWRRSNGTTLGVAPEGGPKGLLKGQRSNSAVLGGVQSQFAALVEAKSADVPGDKG